MRRLFVLLFCSCFVGCAMLENPFSEFYQDRTGGIDITKSPAVVLSEGDPIIYTGGDPKVDEEKLYEDGYNLLGFSSFNAGNATKEQLIAQARKVKAAVVTVYSQYTNTLSGTVPLTLPNNQTVTTTYSGMGNSSGNIYGSNGNSATYHGNSNTYGTANTTIYGTQTTYIPYSQNRYDYLATFWIKMKMPIFGVGAIDLTSEQRSKIGSNKGVYVSVVIKGSSAYLADIFKGDIITKMNDNDVVDLNTFKVIESMNMGKKVSLTIIRDDKTLTKEVQFSEGDMVQDIKYGSIGAGYRIFLNTNSNLNKTALIHFDKIFNAFNKSKENGLNWEELKANPQKAADPVIMSKINSIVGLIEKIISEYGNKNQYRAIFSYKLPNINESEDLTDTFISILNNK